MPYTITKGLLWYLLALILGLIIGWFLRNLKAHRQIARARAMGSGSDDVELERLRGRVANLEPVVAERDRLRTELDACRAQAAADAARATTATTQAAAGVAVAAEAGASDTQIQSIAAASPITDTAGAAEILGKRIKADDLTVVEGIGPAISNLCNGIGIHTWAELATTEVSLLRTMLDDAGSRFQMHDPTTWPEQASLLAAGRWADFKTLTDQLDGGRRI